MPVLKGCVCMSSSVAFPRLPSLANHSSLLLHGTFFFTLLLVSLNSEKAACGVGTHYLEQKSLSLPGPKAVYQLWCSSWVAHHGLHGAVAGDTSTADERCFVSCSSSRKVLSFTE